MKGAVYLFIAFILAALLMIVFQDRSGGNTHLPVTEQTSVVVKPEEKKNLTTIQWLDSAKNIGKIRNGEKVEISFRFRNTGEYPLVVSDVAVSCGCTVAEKPEQAISPGKEGMIKAAFHSEGRVGANHKTITVQTNTPEGITNLSFDVEVVDNL